MKNGKARPDGIPPEALKINPNTTAEMLHPLFLKIAEAEKDPTEWKHGYLVKLPIKGDRGLCNNWRGIMLLSIPSKLMHHCGIPSKFIKLIQDLYESSSCQVIYNGKLSESFETSTGVRQGCLLSPMIVIMVVDWIMREVEDQGA
ncbi:hypothetical protein ACROYT_G005358 [Oculina patagonica]